VIEELSAGFMRIGAINEAWIMTDLHDKGSKGQNVTALLINFQMSKSLLLEIFR